MASNQEINITVKVDAQGAISVLDSLGNEIKKVEAASDSVASSQRGVFGAFTELNSALELSKKAYSAVTGAANTFLDAVSKGDQINDVTSAFGELSDKAGATASVLVGQLQEATLGSISKFDLMKSANDAMVAGLKPEVFVQMANAAKQMADRTGIDATTAINQLSNGIQTGNQKILKQYGIVLDTTKVIEEYLKANGVAANEVEKLASKVDDATKLQLFQAEASKQLADKTFDVTKATIGAGDQLDRLKATLSNARDESLAALDSNEHLAQAFEHLNEAASAIDFTGIASGLAEIAAMAIEAGSALVDTLIPGLKQMEEAKKVTDAFGKVSGAIDTMNKAIVDLQDKGGLDKTQKALDQLKKTVNESGDAIKSKFGGSVDVLQVFLNNKAKLLPEVTKKTDDYVASLLKQLHQEDAANEAARESKKAAEEHTKALEDLSAAAYEAAGVDRFPKLAQEFRDTFQDQYVKAPEYIAAQIETIGQNALDAGIKIDSIKDALSGAKDAIDKIREIDLKKSGGGKSTFDSFLTSILGFDINDPAAAGKATEALGQVYAQAIAQGLSTALSALGGNHLSNAQIGGSIGSVGGTIGGGVIGASIGGPIGALIGAQIGNQLGSQLGSMIGGLFHGTSDPGTKARKEADKFFADIFNADRLSVIVNGELRRINDLTFGSGSAFGSGDAFSFLQSLPADVQAAFSGVGSAFETLLANGEDMAGQLGAVFANNIGGSLNNLQLLVQATGKSFEDLQKGVVDAFLDGKLSAGEAQNAINQLRIVMEKGIPGAVGAVTQAFDNMKAAGKSGGRALVDALQDVGTEAKELGLHTLAEVQNYLASTGKYSAEEIQKVFDALKASGINSVDALSNATTEQLLPALASLDQQGVLKETIQGVGDLIDKVNSLPNEIRRKITFDVSANYDSTTTQKVLNSALDNGPDIGQRAGIPH